MKHFTYTILLCTLLCLHIDYTYAEDPSDFYNYNAISAHITDMFRYGEYQTSLFIGRMQVTIPIYTLDDPDFKMDIALHYNAEGFKPRKHSGYVGYNWFLEAGGCITREVNGLPDEIYGYEETGGYNVGVEGMYHFITQNTSSSNWDMDDVFELPLASNSQACQTGNYLWHNIGNSCDYKVDYMPDIFHFDFLGYKGTFMIDNAGKVQILSGDYINVDLSNILTDWVPTTIPSLPTYPKENSSITIKTNDGYTYIFGGDLSKLEYTVGAYNHYYFLPPTQSGYGPVNPAIVNTWHLAKIIAPNNRIVTYHYKPASNIYTNYLNIPTDAPGEDSPLWEFNEHYDRFGRYYSVMGSLHDQIVANNASHLFDSPYTDEEYQCLLEFYTPPYFYTGNSYYMYSATKACVLDSICISGSHPLSIIFDNSQETIAMYNCPTRYRYNVHRNYQLDSVRIFSSDDIIKTAHLSYAYKSHTENNYSFNWRFLTAVSISGIGLYQMNYNNGTFPDLYNQNPNYDVTIGATNEADDYGYFVGSYTIALLQKLTYPTGGYQTYLYQPYSYNKKRKYSVVANSDVEMATINESGTKKGARIHEVKTYDVNNHLIETKSYSYSNGIFFDKLKVYNLAENLYPQYGWPIRYKANYGSFDTHIGYGMVTENVTNSQGDEYNTIYQFDLGENIYSSSNDVDMHARYYCNNQKFGIMEGHLLYGSRLKKWGKLKSVVNYNHQNQLLKSESYEYNDVPQIGRDTIVIFDCGSGVEFSKKLYFYPNLLTKKITKDYNQADSVVVTQSYLYDSEFRIKKETISDSRNIQHFTKYTYPDDLGVTYGFPEESPIHRLVRDNRINTPVEVVSGYMSGNTEMVTSGTINLYATGYYWELPNSPHAPGLTPTFPYGGFIDPIYIPDSIFDTGLDVHTYPFLSMTKSLSLTAPISDYGYMGANGASVTYDSRYRTICEYIFNPCNRPISIKPLNKPKTIYTWEHWDDIYPSSKTTGNQTWTYTHIPYVGVGSTTDPWGVTTYYTYDTLGRLIEEYQIIGGKKQILSVYRYHIKTE